MKQDREVERLIAFVLIDLKSCGTRTELQWGRRIHAKAVEYQNDANKYVVTALVKMYAKCGSMLDARCIFDATEKPSVMAWTALLLGYADNGDGYVALDLFSRMKEHGCVPDSITYVAAVKACTTVAVNGGNRQREFLQLGREIHSEACSHVNHYVQNSLIDMYAKFGSMVDARDVFESIQKPDLVSWNALLLGYAENDEGLVALELFSRMKDHGYMPNSVTYVAALKACTSLGDARSLEHGRKIHSEIGCNLNHYVQGTLIDMYAKCRSMVEARRVFDSIHKPDVVSWNVLLLGYAENGEGMAALDLFLRMKTHGVLINSGTYVASIKACTSLAVQGDVKGCFERGKEIHLEIGWSLDPYIQSTLVEMYCKCGSMRDARRIFDSMTEPSVVAWNVLLLGYAGNGEGHVALDLFSTMKERGFVPDSVTYVAAVKSITSLAVNEGGGDCLERGRKIHSEIGTGLEHNVQSTLIEMYSKCGSMLEARQVFDSIEKPNVVSWTTLLLGYAENGEGHAALDLFSTMKAAGCVPNSVTYVGALKACGLIRALTLGRRLHSEISEFTAHVVTCLVDFYAKCGTMAEAREVFDIHLQARDVTTWNAILAGYSSFGDPDSVFNLFKAMQDEGFRPNAVTFVCMLLCCSHAGLVEKAREYIEAMPVQYEVIPSVMHYTCIVDILGRANQLNEAITVLHKMPCNPHAVVWRTLLDACRKWENVEIGRIAFQTLLGIDKKDASAHLLMAQIYGSRGMWEAQKEVMELKARLS